jgi:hypothetical protein
VPLESILQIVGLGDLEMPPERCKAREHYEDKYADLENAEDIKQPFVAISECA